MVHCVAHPAPYPFAEYVFTKVTFIPENPYNSGIGPEVVFLNAGSAYPGAACRPLIEHGRRHSFPVQQQFCAVTVRRHEKDICVEGTFGTIIHLRECTQLECSFALQAKNKININILLGNYCKRKSL